MDGIKFAAGSAVDDSMMSDGISDGSPSMSGTVDMQTIQEEISSTWRVQDAMERNPRQSDDFLSSSLLSAIVPSRPTIDSNRTGASSNQDSHNEEEGPESVSTLELWVFTLRAGSDDGADDASFPAIPMNHRGLQGPSFMFPRASLPRDCI